MPIMSDTVTLNKAHFEALLRRAEFYSAEPQYFEAFPLQNVSIPRVEYESLRQSEKELQTLKNALLGGGIAPETLDTLIQGRWEPLRKDSASAPDIWTETAKVGTISAHYPQISGIEPDEVYVERSFGKNLEEAASGVALSVSWQQENHRQMPKQELTWQQQQDFARRPYSPVSFGDLGEAGVGSVNGHAGETRCTRPEPRTLLITGLSDRITYKDLTNVIRGGRILYIMIRGDRTAALFMSEGAAEFLAHVKRHDLYVQTKRLEVTWNDYQFTLAPYVGRKIAGGATRNLVIRNAAHIVNLADIREHMEHIHKFNIIDIVVRGRDVLVYTNSVHNALFARTCMMSRQPYKGLKIGFLPDECAGPLPVRESFPSSRTPSGPVKTQASSNLFEVLSLDSDEENCIPGREDDDDNTLDGDDGSDYGVSLA